MPKLFVAVDLPATATAELVRIQPMPITGLRAAKPEQMHLSSNQRNTRVPGPP